MKSYKDQFSLVEFYSAQLSSVHFSSGQQSSALLSSVQFSPVQLCSTQFSSDQLFCFAQLSLVQFTSIQLSSTKFSLVQLSESQVLLIPASAHLRKSQRTAGKPVSFFQSLTWPCGMRGAIEYFQVTANTRKSSSRLDESAISDFSSLKKLTCFNQTKTAKCAWRAGESSIFQFLSLKNKKNRAGARRPFFEGCPTRN